MSKWLLGVAFALLLAGCANHLQTLDQQLKTALAGEPVVITSQEASSGVSGLFKQSGTITLTSSADYLYPSGGYELRPGAPVLSKVVPIFRNFQHTTITVIGYTDTTPVGPQLQRMGISNNTDLSLKRASEAVAFFQSQGVNPNLLNAKGFGEANLLLPTIRPRVRREIDASRSFSAATARNIDRPIRATVRGTAKDLISTVRSPEIRIGRPQFEL